MTGGQIAGTVVGDRVPSRTVAPRTRSTHEMRSTSNRVLRPGKSLFAAPARMSESTVVTGYGRTVMADVDTEQREAMANTLRTLATAFVGERHDRRVRDHHCRRRRYR